MIAGKSSTGTMRGGACMLALAVLVQPLVARAAEDADASEGSAESAKPEKRRAPMKSQADIDKEAGTGEKEKGSEDSFGHGMQFGLRAGVVFGYKMVFRYQHSPFCTTPSPHFLFRHVQVQAARVP